MMFAIFQNETQIGDGYPDEQTAWIAAHGLGLVVTFSPDFAKEMKPSEKGMLAVGYSIREIGHEEPAPWVDVFDESGCLIAQAHPNLMRDNPALVGHE